MNAAQGLTIALASLGVIGLITGAAVVVRSSILKTTNEVLATALEVERGERKETESRCGEQIAELRGTVATLTRDHARTVAHEVIRVFREEGVLPPR